MFNYENYLRINKFPHIWCPGCGDGTILKSMLRAIHKLGIEKNDVVMVSGIGCSSRTPGYVDFNTLHTTHGRALTFATGVKHAKPEMNVIVVSGDGDATAIGGNHFIHAARRNIDITMVIYNNYIYGMTGGQASPTTPIGAFASTAQYGSIDPIFNIGDLAKGAGASFVARTTSYHTGQMEMLFKKAIAKKGFSVVEVVVQCPTAFGRRNKLKTPVSMLHWMKDNAVPVKAAEKMSPEQLEGKFTTGVLWDIERPEYTEQYRQLSKRVVGDH
ncbi:2-oxoacid:ferredoxin oxidoreductase subunit beta [bacterium]|nr:2-oxoacid:ferredoxin oxidoreductase subunit beta [bacterium]